MPLNSLYAQTRNDLYSQMCQLVRKKPLTKRDKIHVLYMVKHKIQEDKL